MTNMFKEHDARMVVAIDPGATTGVAVVRATADSVTIDLTQNIEFGMRNPAYFREDLLNVMEHVTDNSEPGSGVVVVEQFVAVGGSPGVDLTPLVVMGAVSMLMTDHREPRTEALDPRVRYQLAADMRTFYRNESLVKELRRKLPPTRARRTDHEMDALAHALTWLSRRGHRPTSELLAGDSA